MRRTLAALAVLASALAAPGVAHAEPPPVATDGAPDVMAAPLGATRVDGRMSRRGGGDPLRGHQWHLDRVDAVSAGGDGVIVAVLDTGVSRAGEDLTCHTFVAPYDARTGRAGPGAADDDNGHGTHVAGTIAQCTGNGVGVAGVAPGARIMPIKVLDGGGAGSFAAVAAGIDWARRHGADVINMSFGSPCGSPWPQCTSHAVDAAIAAAVAEDIVLVAAAGNHASPYVDYPASHPDVIAVGATVAGGDLAGYSNRGRQLDLVAPGGVPVDDADGDGFPDGVVQETFRHGAWGYWAWAGSSFAAPHVTGAAAVLRGAAPWATAADVRAALRCEAADGGHPGPDEGFGYGELRVAAALTAATSAPTDTSPPFWRASPMAATAAGRHAVELTWEQPWECSQVAEYLVFVNDEPVASADGRAGRFLVEGLDAGTVYSFRVEARDGAGNWSRTGPVAAARTLDDGAGVVLDAGPALGLVDPATGVWHLRDGHGAAVSFYYGDPGDQPFMGDWDCDGEATPGLYRRRDGFVYLRNSTSQGNADLEFYFGNPGDLPLAGDFDGDGCDTVALYRPAEATVYVINELGAAGRGLGRADYSYSFGDPGDLPFVGDFDGDGVDEVGVHRPATGWVYVPVGSGLDAFGYAEPGDVVFAGDFDGDGVATVALRRPDAATVFFHDGTDPVGWGEPDWLPVVPG